MMETPLNLKPGRLNLCWIAAVTLLTTLNTLAQSGNETILSFDAPIKKAFIDRPGDLYIMTTTTVSKLSPSGSPLQKHSFQLPTLFDPWYAVHYFSYTRSNQQCILLHPDFEIKEIIELDPVYAIDPYLICLAGEKNLWIYDQADTSIKKINTTDHRVLIDERISLPQNSNIMYMREYQGFLFLLDYNNGIHVYNMVGRHLKTIGTAGITDFNFLGEELYYIQENALVFFDLFDGRSRSKLIDGKPNQILLTDKVSYFIYSNRVIIKSNE